MKDFYVGQRFQRSLSVRVYIYIHTRFVKKSIRIEIVVVVHWVGCVCNKSWHVRTCLSNSWHKLQVAAFAQLAVAGRGSNTCLYVMAIFTMCESTEQRICIMVCLKIGKTATETYKWLQQVYGEDGMGRTQVFDWFRQFKECGAQNIVKEIKQYQKKWLQHVQRMDTNRIPKQALRYRPKGRRNIGRPKKRRRDQLHFED